MDHPSSPRSSAEKRILWELGQRYNGSGSARVSPRLTPPAPPRRPARLKRGRPSWARRLVLSLVALALLSGGIFGYKILAASNRISVADRSLLGQLRDLLLRSGDSLKGEKDGRINILLLAIGGEGHSGENLADTIIVASILPHTDRASEVALLSIPRDLYVQVPGEQYFSKINAVHAYGESQGKDKGPMILGEKVADITGLPIHYFIRLDFTAFKHIVDAVGGVTVANDQAFFDYWHKIDFQAGTEKMNGDRALAYARARYIEGPEGGDFKRAARQQKVLLALREKVFSVQTAFDFAAVNSILNALANNIRTDMHLWEMKRFYELARTIDTSTVHSVILTTGPNGLLEGGTEVLGGAPASILRPRTGDYSETQNLAQNIFSQEIKSQAAGAAQATPTVTATPEEPSEAKPTLEIRNGTNITGLASRFKTKLEAQGYVVLVIGNAKNRSAAKTTVYALDTKYADAVTSLAEAIEAQSDSGLPSDEPASEANVLIILGQS